MHLSLPNNKDTFYKPINFLSIKYHILGTMLFINQKAPKKGNPLLIQMSFLVKKVKKIVREGIIIQRIMI